MRSSRRLASPPPAPGAIASVRLDRGGEVVASFGAVELLAQLVAYVGRLGSLLSNELGLDPFQALHAELLGRRFVMFADGRELVGLLLEPGADAQLLRQRLGV